jgi:hypothetical protein
LQTVEIDFDTDNLGRWITHCHNDYQLESGMAIFVYYGCARLERSYAEPATID